MKLTYVKVMKDGEEIDVGNYEFTPDEVKELPRGGFEIS